MLLDNKFIQSKIKSLNLVIFKIKKCSNKSQAALSPNIKEIFNTKRSNDEIANKLITDLKTSGVRLGEQLNVAQLTSVS